MATNMSNIKLVIEKSERQQISINTHQVNFAPNFSVCVNHMWLSVLTHGFASAILFVLLFSLSVF